MNERKYWHNNGMNRVLFIFCKPWSEAKDGTAVFFIAIIMQLVLQILITEIEYLSHRNMGIKEIVEWEWY